jgi:hypothetical protein
LKNFQLLQVFKLQFLLNRRRPVPTFRIGVKLNFRIIVLKSILVSPLTKALTGLSTAVSLFRFFGRFDGLSLNYKSTCSNPNGGFLPRWRNVIKLRHDVVGGTPTTKLRRCGCSTHSVNLTTLPVGGCVETNPLLTSEFINLK